MRKLLLSAAATMLIAGPASAADLAVKAPPPGAAYIASPWDGLNIGGNLGYGLALLVDFYFLVPAALAVRP